MESEEALNGNFFYNSMLARALIQLLPANERTLIRMWMDKLNRMDQTFEEMTIRNEYIWFLVLMLQSRRVTVPFKNVPPEDLPPLAQILPLNVYEEVLTASSQSEYVPSSFSTSYQRVFIDEKKETISSHPANFIYNQPQPRDGIICYLAAFSDQDN